MEMLWTLNKRIHVRMLIPGPGTWHLANISVAAALSHVIDKDFKTLESKHLPVYLIFKKIAVSPLFGVVVVEELLIYF